MKERFKYVVAFFMLWVFISPTIVKIEHHHEVFTCDAKGEQHLHQYHQKCEICTFEFPLFEALPNKISFQIEPVVVDFYNKHNSPNYFNPAKYSFLLRAPPSGQA